MHTHSMLSQIICTLKMYRQSTLFHFEEEENREATIFFSFLFLYLLLVNQKLSDLRPKELLE